MINDGAVYADRLLPSEGIGEDLAPATWASLPGGRGRHFGSARGQPGEVRTALTARCCRSVHGVRLIRLS